MVQLVILMVLVRVGVDQSAVPTNLTHTSTCHAAHVLSLHLRLQVDGPMAAGSARRAVSWAICPVLLIMWMHTAQLDTVSVNMTPVPLDLGPTAVIFHDGSLGLAAVIYTLVN
jgi:hypothetical protein